MIFHHSKAAIFGTLSFSITSDSTLILSNCEADDWAESYLNWSGMTSNSQSGQNEEEFF